MPIDVRLAKLVIFGYLFDVLEDCIIIAAGLSSKSIFAFPFDKKLKAYANKLQWSNQVRNYLISGNYEVFKKYLYNIIYGNPNSKNYYSVLN